MKTLFLCYALLGTLALAAQPVPDYATCRLICLAPSQGPVPSLIAGPAEAPLRVDLPREEMSRPTPLPMIDGKIVFRHPVTGEPAASVSIPQNRDGGILLFVPSAENSYRVLYIDETVATRSPGSSLVYNATAASLRLSIGEQKILTKPGQIAAVKRPAKRDDYQMSPVTFQIEKGEGWATTYESAMRFTENQHRLFIIYTHPVSKSVAMRVLRFLPRLPEATASYSPGS